MSMTELYKRKAKAPLVGDRAVTHMGCYRTVTAVKRSILHGESITSDCSNPKSCCSKTGGCDLSGAVIERKTLKH